MTETKNLLEAKLNLVRAGANIFGGGIWSPNNDLNWAFQQIRPKGKPAGNKPEFNQKAADMLKQFIPSLEADEAGALVKTIHTLTHQHIKELRDDGMDTIEASKIVFGLIEEKIGKPDRI